MKKPHDPVNSPKHYTGHPSGVECITITRHMNFNRGNAMKYIWRAGEKGNLIEDLKKAIWYLQDEIGRLEAEAAKETAAQPSEESVAAAKEARAAKLLMEGIGKAVFG